MACLRVRREAASLPLPLHKSHSSTVRSPKDTGVDKPSLLADGGRQEGYQIDCAEVRDLDCQVPAERDSPKGSAQLLVKPNGTPDLTAALQTLEASREWAAVLELESCDTPALRNYKRALKALETSAAWQSLRVTIQADDGADESEALANQETALKALESSPQWQGFGLALRRLENAMDETDSAPIKSALCERQDSVGSTANARTPKETDIPSEMASDAFFGRVAGAVLTSACHEHTHHEDMVAEDASRSPPMLPSLLTSQQKKTAAEAMSKHTGGVAHSKPGGDFEISPSDVAYHGSPIVCSTTRSAHQLLAVGCPAPALVSCQQVVDAAQDVSRAMKTWAGQAGSAFSYAAQDTSEHITGYVSEAAVEARDAASAGSVRVATMAAETASDLARKAGDAAIASSRTFADNVQHTAHSCADRILDSMHRYHAGMQDHPIQSL